MSRQDINTEFNTFVGGILTEANPINYPKGFTQDEENFILERDGTRRRRRGLDFETGFTTTTISKDVGASNSVVQDHVIWGDDKLVILDNEEVSAFDIDTTGTISTTESTIITSASDQIYGLATYRDFLIIARDGVSKNYPTLTGGGLLIDTQAFDVYDKAESLVGTFHIQVRDFAGIDDTLDTTERPATLSNEHLYNLLNQGWTSTNITAFDTAIGDFPSNADNMNTGLDGETGVFTSSWVDLANNGYTETSKGRAILDLFEPNKSRPGFIFTENGSTSGSLAGSDPTGIIADMQEHAGRLFFLSNFTVDGEFGSTVLSFSGAGVKPEDLGKCYQANDPTSRDNNTLLDSDGGHLDISSVGTGYKLVSLKDRIFIFGSNGVFELFGRDSLFKPAEINIRKVTQEGALPPASTASNSAAKSVTVSEDSIFYFARSGIMQITYDANGGMYTSINISNDKIQTLYNEIDERSRSAAEGLYVPSDQTIRFCYNDESTVSIDHKDTELVYDLVLRAWYKNKFVDTALALTSHYILFPFSVKVNIAQSTYPVDDNLRYAVVEHSTSVDNPYRFCSFKDTSFKDFNASGTSRDAAAFMQTGFINAGDSQRRKQANYIIPSFIRTEDGFTDDGGGDLTPTNESSCNIRADWDYADTDGGNLFGTVFEAYRFNRLYIPSGPADLFDYGQSVITTKNKLRGRGRALSLRFTTTALKDCRLLGWGLGFEVDTRV